MAWRYTNKNYRPFTALCDCHFGRVVIKTDAENITVDNVVTELNKALSDHSIDQVAISYLDNYYRGDQPILYRVKQNRPEVNNKVVVNLAWFAVETKTAEMTGEPIQYVLHGKDEKKSAEIADLNSLVDGEDKAYEDIELCRWRSVCGTAYRYVGHDKKKTRLLDESPFYLNTPDPRDAFVVYDSDDRPKFGVYIKTTETGKSLYWIYTDSVWFKVSEGKVLESGTNGLGAIPIIEYPNNARRISDIEITISITDELNKMASDRSNGIEQFVASWVKFVNCEIDEVAFRKMRAEGALAVKSNNGSENKADVDILSQELNQTESQVVVSDLYDKFLEIQGMSNRQKNSGGDTGNAVMLRNGFYNSEKRAEISEPIFKRSERMALRIILNILRIESGFTLVPSDIEIKISRSKLDNMLTKAEVLQILLKCGIDSERAIKTVNLFSDPEQVAIESRERMDILYPKDAEAIVDQSKTQEIE